MRGTWIVSAVVGLIAIAIVWMFAESIYRQWKSGKPLSALETHIGSVAGISPGLLPGTARTQIRLFPS